MPKLSIPIFLFLIILGALIGLTPFAVDMYLPSLVQISQEINQPQSVTQLSISIFLLVFAIAQLIYGPLSDSFGRKRILMIGLSIFILASAAITQIETITQLLVLRAIQAAGGAALAVCVNATLRDYFTGNQLAKTMSYLMMIVITAPMIAPFIGGQILRFYDWQMIFYVLTAMAVFFGSCFYFLIDESHTKSNRPVFNFKAIFMGYWAIFKHPNSLAYIFLGGFSSAPMFVFIINSSSVYQTFLGISAQDFGYYFGANTVVMMICSWLNTRLLNKYDYLQIMHSFIFIRMIPISVLLVLSLTVESHIIYYLVPGIILSIGLMPLVGPNASTALLVQHGKLAGSASAIAGTARFGIGAVAGSIASLTQINNNHISMVVWMFVFTALCLVLSIWIKKNSKNED